MPSERAQPALPQDRGRLWRHRGFLLLWGGQSVLQLGSQITIWALPLTAVYALRASAAQIGLLLAAGTLLAFLWLLWSPVRRLRSHPTAPDEQAFAPASLA